jgi:hypothetical protein
MLRRLPNCAVEMELADQWLMSAAVPFSHILSVGVSLLCGASCEAPGSPGREG